MKKILVCIVAFFMASGAYAQLSGGLKAGLNLATQKYELDGVSVSENGTSFHIGFFVDFSLSDAITLQPELLYNSLKIEDSGESVTTNYLSIPVMFLYGFADNKFNVQAGPQIGLLLSTDPSDYKDADIYSGTDFGLNLGAGANFGKISATLRYCLGLGNNAGSAWDGAGYDVKITNNVLQLSVGYKLFGE